MTCKSKKALQEALEECYADIAGIMCENEPTKDVVEDIIFHGQNCLTLLELLSKFADDPLEEMTF